MLATELYTVAYHPIEQWVDMEVEGDVAKVSFLPVVPDTIRVQVEQVEATSTDTATPDSQENRYLGLGLIHNLQILISRQKSNG